MSKSTITSVIRIFKITFIVILLSVNNKSFAQTNTFPTTGNVGIGTTSPGALLHVLGNAQFGNGTTGATSPITIKGPNSPTNINSYQDINYSFTSAGSARIRSYRGGSWGTFLQFLVNSNSAGSDNPQVAMHIDQSGNVGVGTNNPGGKFQVSDGNEDGTKYGSVQIVRAPLPSDNAFHLSFVRGGNAVAGIGFANDNTNNFCIWQAFNNSSSPLMTFAINQTVGIGTTDTKGYKLGVNGAAIFTKAVVKSNANWPDYVFEPQYNLPSLQSVEAFIKINHRLPDMPSASDIADNGIDLGDNQILLLKKTEELTLYIIGQNKKLEQQQALIDQLGKLVKEQQEIVAKLQQDINSLKNK